MIDTAAVITVAQCVHSLALNMLQDADATLCTVADALVYATISRIL